MRTPKGQQGFTLMEIMVATVIFAIIFSSLLSLFNYVLKINRQTEALRQSAQGARDFVEFLVKEVRNGQIDYYVSNGQYTAKIGGSSSSSPCGPAGSVGASAISTDPATYSTQDNKLGIINTDGVQECFYYANTNGNYAGLNNFSAGSGQTYTLAMWKDGLLTPQILTPPNFRVDRLMFLIRPLCDPYTSSPCTAYSGYPNIQPSVAIILQFTVKLPTGEVRTLNYQTVVSSNKYDIQ